MPCALAGPSDPLERVQVARVVELARDAEAVGQVGRPDEQDVDAVERGDLVGVADRARRLDLDDADDPLVDDRAMSAWPSAPSPAPRSAGPRRACRPAGSAGYADGLAACVGRVERGTMIPAAPRSSARPIRSRSADCGRTSAAIGVAPTA